MDAASILIVEDEPVVAAVGVVRVDAEANF